MRLGFDHLSGRGWSGERGLLLISPLEGEMPGRAEGGKPHPPTTRYECTAPVYPAAISRDASTSRDGDSP
ncbi:UNVERIFIED_ORG: hypothetical protein QE446_002387 [Rhizobium sp. SORGH_AS260]|jgi:hypothetical protein|nr:hypothetical protein [Rhizobium sp. SORGH_AS_0285]MDP9754511.1 hypothetical protein [Rhizobium sp. SORGH_AS_0260]MDR6082836.1 hypothetical protein [Agrobacterium sp. SORGH_AS_0440]